MITSNTDQVVEQLLEAAGGLDDLVVEVLLEAAAEVRDELRVGSPVDSGRLRDGWEIERLPDGAAVVTDVPYAPFVPIDDPLDAVEGQVTERLGARVVAALE